MIPDFRGGGLGFKNVRHLRVKMGHKGGGDHKCPLKIGIFFKYYDLPCKEVFGECVQDIDTEAKISFADRDVHTDYLIFVRFMYL